MKRKNSDSRVRRRLLPMGVAFLLLLALIPVMALCYKLGMVHQSSINSEPQAALLDGNSPIVHAPAYPVLQQVQPANPLETLVVTGWIEPKGTKCLGVIRFEQNRPIDTSHAFHGSITECDLDRYSIDQFWTGKLWDHEPYSFAYGYSGDAASVVVTWQDNTVTPYTPVNSTYIAIHEARWLAIRSVDFFDADGVLIYRLPDDKRRGTASRQDGS